MRDSAYTLIRPIGFTRQSVIIPAFSYVSVWSGVSQLLARYALSNTADICIKRPIEQPNDSFISAVSWMDEDGNTFRYKLTEDISEVLYYPLYEGTNIGPSAYLEIWSVEDFATAAITANWILELSGLIAPTICNPCQENTSSVTLLPII